MANLVSFFSVCIAVILLLGTTTMCEQTPESALPPAPKALSHGLNVLVIGDSNTEIGNISGGLARLFEQEYGYFGSGYHSLNKTIGMGSGYLPYLKIENVGQWESYTMLWPTAASKPYIAPEGSCVRGATPAAHTDVSFYGNAIDLYWLATPAGGTFDILVDDVPRAEVSTDGRVSKVRRTRISGLRSGWHKLQASVKTGMVTLEGVDAIVNQPGLAHRATVHKWGKGWASTSDYLDVDETVFSSALKLLHPDVVVILLGTNDHNLRGNNRDQFADNLSAIVSRIHRATPGTRILLVSTYQINGTWTNMALKQYVEVFPEIARENRAYYWDMCTWFGPFEAAKQNGWFLEDGIHASEKGGAHIAEQLFKEIDRVASSTPFSCPKAVKEHLRRIGVLSTKDAAPAKVSGLLSWWSADGPVTVDPQRQVCALSDISGRKTDAVARWTHCRPTLVGNALNGKPVIRFDGSKKQYLTFPLAEKAQTFIVVAKGRGVLFGHPYFMNRPFNPSVTDPSKMLAIQYASPALTGGKAYVNGVNVAPCDVTFPEREYRVISLVATGPVGVAYLGWGGSWNLEWNSDGYFSGDIAEVMIFDRALSDSERNGIERYLQAKYGIS